MALSSEYRSGYEPHDLGSNFSSPPPCPSPFHELPAGPASYLFWTAMGVGKDSYMFQNFGVYPFDRLNDTERIIVLTEVAEAMSGYKADLKCNVLNESALYAVFALMKARIKKELDDAEKEEVRRGPVCAHTLSANRPSRPPAFVACAASRL